MHTTNHTQFMGSQRLWSEKKNNEKSDTIKRHNVL